MSKSSSYKQGPSLVARQSKGYSGDRSGTDARYPHLHPPVPLVRAELLRAAVVVELRGRGAAHQPRLQQVLPGGVGQQQRVPLQHRRPGHQQIVPRLTLEFSNFDIDLQYLHVKIFTIEGSAFTWNWDIYICLQRFSSLMVCPIIFPKQQTACR